MEKLPEEMLRAVFVYLPGTDRLPVSLTCRRWFNLLKDSVPSISVVHISLDTSACSTRFLEASLSEATLSICLCPGMRRNMLFCCNHYFKLPAKSLQLQLLRIILYQRLVLSLSWITLIVKALDHQLALVAITRYSLFLIKFK